MAEEILRRSLSQQQDKAAPRNNLFSIILLTPPGLQVMLVSAHEALLARLVLLGKASEEEQRMFSIKAWGSSWARKKQKKSDEEMRRQAEAMLEESRLPQLEDRLFSYLYTNAGGLKLLSLLDNMSRLLNEVRCSSLDSRP